MGNVSWGSVCLFFAGASSLALAGEPCSGPVDLSSQFSAPKEGRKSGASHTLTANAALEAALHRMDHRNRELSEAHALNANVLQMSDEEFARFFLNVSSDPSNPSFDGRDVSSVAQALLRDGRVVVADSLDPLDVQKESESWARLLSHQQKNSLSEQEFRRLVTQTENALLKRSRVEKTDLSRFRFHLYEALGVQGGAFAQELDALSRADDPATKNLFKRRYPELNLSATKPLDVNALREKSVARCDLSSGKLQQYVKRNLCANIPLIASVDTEGSTRSVMLTGFQTDQGVAYLTLAKDGTTSKLPMREACRIKELGALLGPGEQAIPLDTAASTALHEVDLSKKPIEADGESVDGLH